MLSAVRWSVVGLLAVSILVLAFAVGYVARGDGGDESPRVTDNDDDGSNGGLTDTDFSNLNEIYKILEERYVDPDFVDRETLYEAAITGLLQPFPDTGTFYIDPVTVRTSTDSSGIFEGIGATVAEESGEIVIVAPIEDTPAERAGIQPGDVILEVDGESTEGWTQEEAVLKIRGPQGTTVTLKIRHEDGEEVVLEIERDEIRVESVTTQPPGGALEDGSGTPITDVAYIYIREFNQRTTDEVRQALEDAVDAGSRGVVVDVRNNPGGLLQTTVDVADEFLDGGIVLTERDRDGSEQEYEADDGGIAVEIPVVILMNRFSASGAEVLAAALHDNDRATLVGEKSFGKGTVNVKNDLNDGGQLYVSVAEWLTPDGVAIDGVGIRPDVEVQLTDEDVDLRRDVQLFKALDILRGTNTAPERTPVPATATPDATPTRSGG